MEVFESFIKGLYLLFSETSILIFVILSIIILLKERIIIDNFKFVIFMFSITFPFILLFLVKLFSNNFSLDGWLGFLGSYLGIVGTFGALYWKSNLEKNEKNKQIDSYISYIIEKNKESFNKNFKNLHKYLYEISSIYADNNNEIKKYSFDLPNFHKNFIENNFEYILTLPRGNDFITLYNILTKINSLTSNFIEHLEKESETLLNYDGYIIEDSFHKKYKFTLDNPYSDDVKEYMINNSHRSAESEIEYYSFYFQGFIIFKLKMSSLIIENYNNDKIFENILTQIKITPQMKNYNENKFGFLEPFQNLTSEYVKTLVEINEENKILKALIFDLLFREYQLNLLLLFSSLVVKAAQYFICSPFYREVMKTEQELRYCDFWIKEFIETFMEYCKILNKFNE
jgi:hypothetical protein